MASRAQPAARGVARFLAKPRAKPTAKGAGKTAAAPSAASEGSAATEPSKAAPSLKIPELLTELEDLFKQLGVRLTYEALGGELGSGGLCKVKGQLRIIIDRRTTPSERVAMLLPLLLRFDIDALPRSATLRDLLARLRPAPILDAAATDASSDAIAAAEPDVAEHVTVAADSAIDALATAQIAESTSEPPAATDA